MPAKTRARRVRQCFLSLLLASHLVVPAGASLFAQDIPGIRDRKPLSWYVGRVETVPGDLYEWDFRDDDHSGAFVFVDGRLVTESQENTATVENRLLSDEHPGDWVGLPASAIVDRAGLPPTVSVVGFYETTFVRLLVYGEIWIILDRTRKVEEVLFHEGLSTRFVYNGIGIGSTMEDVLAAFPETQDVVRGQFVFPGAANTIFLELPCTPDAGYAFYDTHDYGIYFTNEIVTAFSFYRN